MGDTWLEWHSHRVSIAKTESEKPPPLEMDNKPLDHWLSCFVMEVRRKDGLEYVGNTIHSLVCGIQRHLRAQKPGIAVDFLSGPEFHRLQSVKKSSIGIKRKQAETISYKDEELLWKSGHLGEFPQGVA